TGEPTRAVAPRSVLGTRAGLGPTELGPRSVFPASVQEEIRDVALHSGSRWRAPLVSDHCRSHAWPRSNGQRGYCDFWPSLQRLWLRQQLARSENRRLIRPSPVKSEDHFWPSSSSRLVPLRALCLSRSSFSTTASSIQVFRGTRT